MNGDVARALAAAGIDAAVEIRDRLVVLKPRDVVPDLTSPERRRALLALAAERGFTHVALELVD